MRLCLPLNIFTRLNLTIEKLGYVKMCLELLARNLYCIFKKHACTELN